ERLAQRDGTTTMENRKARAMRFLLRGGKRIRQLVSLGLMLATVALLATITDGSRSSAHAQVALTVEFREMLGAYGRWVEHPRWGTVWIPVGTQTDWRPYRFGHWVYTDEWGWYWIADEEWGWIAYHYGRWILDREFGWIWVPGDEWSPAWVRWR